MCYATLAFVTDYDCWHHSEEPVTVEMVVANLQRSVEVAKTIVKAAVSQIPHQRDCACATALKDAIITSPEQIPAYLKEDLALLISKYLK
jgi:5'-methylthioadenosine phosphorylase